uniref:peptidylprolyl isomerase n=1 Tax=Arion vulgaris TaxID=1028688 RepID=A0A0B7A3R8_9EUPU
MHVKVFQILFALPLLSLVVLVASQEPKKSKFKRIKEIEDEEVLLKLKQKKLVTLQMSKPEDCHVLTENQDEVQVHYTGYLETGEIFDSSETSGKDPITFILGSKQVIRGWDEGLLNMCVGEKRRLIIPPDLAYGKTGFPPVIPSDATLLFEVTLLGLNKQGFGSNLGDIQSLLQLGKFLLLPAAILYVFYYLYGRYKEEEAKSSKGHKLQSRGKNSRKRKIVSD